MAFQTDAFQNNAFLKGSIDPALWASAKRLKWQDKFYEKKLSKRGRGMKQNVYHK